MWKQMSKDINDFYGACDRFIAGRKQKNINLHPTEFCAKCDTVIEPDEPMVEAEGLPYHKSCFKEFMRGE